MPSKFNRRLKKKNHSSKSTNDFPSFYDFSKTFFDMLAEELSEEGFDEEAGEVSNLLINPKKRIKEWNENVSSLPKEFPNIDKIKLSTLTATNTLSIQKAIQKIEDLSSEGEEYYDKLEKLKKKLTNYFSKWLNLLETKNLMERLADPVFVIEIFIDFAFNYEGEFESSLLCSESFLCSHFIRKTWTDDETYLWAPFTMFYFFNFLNIHKIIDSKLLDSAINALIQIKDQFYLYYGRYINPKEADSVLEDMMFL